MSSINNGSPSWITISNDEIFQRLYFAGGLYRNRYIIIAGGRRMAYLLRSVTMFDIQTRKSIHLPDLPFKGNCKGLTVNNHFYIISNVSKKRLVLYRLCLFTRSKWEKMGNLSEIPNHIQTVVACGSDLFILTSDEMYCYDLVTHVNIKISNVPRNMKYFSATSAGGNIFLIGYTLDVFNVATQSWSQSHPLPIPLFDTAATTILNRWIVVTGGRKESYEHNYKTYIYDTMQQRWIENNLGLDLPRMEHGCFAYNSHIIKIGGIAIGFGYDNQYSPIKSIHSKHLIPHFIWETIREFVLLRKLLDDNRANPTVAAKRFKKNTDDQLDEDKVIQRLFTDVPLDVFRKVISFLI